MSDMIGYVYKPPTITELQDRISELNGVIESYQKQLRDKDAALRDRFAAAALTGLLAQRDVTPSKAAVDSYRYADAMMIRRTSPEAP
jgi:hypothetical protein